MNTRLYDTKAVNRGVSNKQELTALFSRLLLMFRKEKLKFRFLRVHRGHTSHIPYFWAHL